MWRLFYCDTAGPIGSVGVLLLRLVMGAAFFLLGPGLYSLDALLFGRLLARNEAEQGETQPSSFVTPTRRKAE